MGKVQCVSYPGEVCELLRNMKWRLDNVILNSNISMFQIKYDIVEVWSYGYICLEMCRTTI